MAQTNRTQFERHGASRAEIFAVDDAPRLALGAGHDDGGPGGFPFRLLAISYGLGLVLAISIVGAGFGVMTALIAAWPGGVAAVTVTPFVVTALEDVLHRAKARARSEAHRRATLAAWARDAKDETANAQPNATAKTR